MYSGYALGSKEQSIIDRCTKNVYHNYKRKGYEGKSPTLPRHLRRENECRCGKPPLVLRHLCPQEVSRESLCDTGVWGAVNVTD